MDTKKSGRRRKAYEDGLSPAEAAIARLSAFHERGDAETRQAAARREGARLRLEASGELGPKRMEASPDIGKPRSFA